ncbi:putative serine/threonine-protein kinase iks1 [Mortierella sp. NVP85]|nr:putative serine/threonine-protein kinase iks1 [Mortierella sp. NVP85]
MLADANIALSRRGSLQADPEMSFQSRPSIGVPTSSSRTSLDLDNEPQGHSTSPQLSHDALNQGYYERFFVEQKKLGRGFRGSVFLCQHVLDGIHLGEYAIKKVAVGDNHDWLVQMLREVHLLERLHHPNIVSYKHAWLENHQLHKFGPEVTCLFILMECANGGNLEEYIERPPTEMNPIDVDPTTAGTSEGAPLNMEGETPKTLTPKELALQAKRQRLQSTLNASSGKGGEGTGTNGAGGNNTSFQRRYLSITEIWSFFFDICEGLAHLHRLGIIHRDLKPPNLLLSYSNSRIKGTKGERPRILITDFGECEILDQADKRDRTGATGTLEFLAPELLAVDADGKYTDEFSSKGDMWSLGMVLYYLCYSRLPYSQIEDVDILRQEIRQFKTITIPEDDGPGGRVIPKDLKILIRVLLSTDKAKRPSCEDILSTLSQQRDRMMHGDMDSPSAPIPGSTSNIEEKNSAQQADDYIGDGGTTKITEEASTGVTKTSSPSQLATKITNSDSSGPNYHSVAISRRMSRPTLTTEKVKGGISGTNSGHHHTLASLASAPYPLGARKAASPSLNLHKKVKPLGIGLRYMLRRKTMHNPGVVSGNGVGLQRYPRTGYSGQAVNTGYSSVVLPLARGHPKVASAAPLSSAMSMELSNKSLVKSSSARASTLPQALQSPLSSSPLLRPPPTQRHQPPQVKEPDAKVDVPSPSPSPLSSGEKSPAPGRTDSSHDVSSSSL